MMAIWIMTDILSKTIYLKISTNRPCEPFGRVGWFRPIKEDYLHESIEPPTTHPRGRLVDILRGRYLLSELKINCFHKKIREKCAIFIQNGVACTGCCSQLAPISAYRSTRLNSLNSGLNFSSKLPSKTRKNILLNYPNPHFSVFVELGQNNGQIISKYLPRHNNYNKRKNCLKRF